MSDRLSGLLAAAIEADIASTREMLNLAYDYALMECGSPIEKLMCVALMRIETPLYGDPNFGFFHRLAPTPSGYFDLDRLRSTDGDFARFFTQAPILNYRADFCIALRLDKGCPLHLIVVECDGHDFHERTKDQARRDRSRDREMTAAGFKVFRFTGSEIFRDPMACADEVGRYISALCREDHP